MSELVTGIDLVKEQLRVAAGEKLATTGRAERRGHAIEIRINAEDPTREFMPAPGRIERFRPPLGPGVRVDTHIEDGAVIPPNYDSLIGKLIVHGRTRNECLMRLRRALDEFVVDGVDTTLPLFRTLVRNPDVQNGEYDIHWLEKFLADGGLDEPSTP